jgi:hypothetical protein
VAVELLPAVKERAMFGMGAPEVILVGIVVVLIGVGISVGISLGNRRVVKTQKAGIATPLSHPATRVPQQVPTRKFCSSCGAAVGDVGSAFCGQCGSKV